MLPYRFKAEPINIRCEEELIGGHVVGQDRKEDAQSMVRIDTEGKRRLKRPNTRFHDYLWG